MSSLNQDSSDEFDSLSSSDDDDPSLVTNQNSNLVDLKSLKTSNGSSLNKSRSLPPHQQSGSSVINNTKQNKLEKVNDTDSDSERSASPVLLESNEIEDVIDLDDDEKPKSRWEEFFSITVTQEEMEKVKNQIEEEYGPKSIFTFFTEKKPQTQFTKIIDSTTGIISKEEYLRFMKYQEFIKFKNEMVELPTPDLYDEKRIVGIMCDFDFEQFFNSENQNKNKSLSEQYNTWVSTQQEKIRCSCAWTEFKKSGYEQTDEFKQFERYEKYVKYQEFKSNPKYSSTLTPSPSLSPLHPNRNSSSFSQQPNNHVDSQNYSQPRTTQPPHPTPHPTQSPPLTSQQPHSTQPPPPPKTTQSRIPQPKISQPNHPTVPVPPISKPSNPPPPPQPNQQKKAESVKFLKQKELRVFSLSPTQNEMNTEEFVELLVTKFQTVDPLFICKNFQIILKSNATNVEAFISMLQHFQDSNKLSSKYLPAFSLKNPQENDLNVYIEAVNKRIKLMDTPTQTDCGGGFVDEIKKRRSQQEKNGAKKLLYGIDAQFNKGIEKEKYSGVVDVLFQQIPTIYDILTVDQVLTALYQYICYCVDAPQNVVDIVQYIIQRHKNLTRHMSARHFIECMEKCQSPDVDSMKQLLDDTERIGYIRMNICIVEGE
ncbi:hypothetical protein QTN25_006161 [Entamoeba marina]